MEEKKAEVSNVEEKDAVENTTADKGYRRKKGLFITCLVIASVMIISIIIYVCISLYFRTHFFPGTRINGIDCSNMNVETAYPKVDSQIYRYSLEVRGRDPFTGESGQVLGTIEAKDVLLSYVDSRELLSEIQQNQEEFKWFTSVFSKEKEDTVFKEVTFDRTFLADFISGWDAFRSENMRKPENAYISGYSHKNREYSIIEEQNGTELNPEKVLGLLEEAILNQDSVIDLEEKECYSEAKILKDDKKLNEAVDTVNKWLSTTILYDWNGNSIVLDADLLKDWITVENNVPVLAEDSVTEYVKKRAKENDTYGKNRDFTTSLGVEITLPGLSYGWRTDTEQESKELIELIYAGETTKREPVYRNQGMVKGKDDIGDTYVEADLTNQHLYLYVDGECIFETDFVSGTLSSTPDCVTPEGVFGIMYKTRNATLTGATYSTKVNYWMPFYGNYGMHDATWRSSFGGAIYVLNGSHGCINLPLKAAEKIYEYVSDGFPVVCYYYEVNPLITEPEYSLPEELTGEQPEPGIPNETPDADTAGIPNETPDAGVTG